MLKKRIGLVVFIGVLMLGINFFESETIFQGLKENSHTKLVNTFKMNGNQSFNETLPIVISQDSDFNTWNGTGFPGNGSSSNPFRIEGFNITSFSGPLISISGTNLHFKIVNNFLFGYNIASVGIMFTNVVNGTIENNNILQSLQGIELRNSNSNNIFNNSISNSWYNGIKLSNFSNNNTISSNFVSDSVQENGIWLESSNNNNISSNVVFDNPNGDGIRLFSSSINNIVTGNVVYNNGWTGIRLEESNSNTLIFNIVYDNQQNGVVLIGSNHNIISKNNVSTNNFVGIRLDYDFGNSMSSVNNTLLENIIYDNNEDGVSLYYVNNNTIFNNSIFRNNWNGMDVGSSNFNTIINNTIYNENDIGIRLWIGSNNNLISNNSIHDNKRIGILFDSVNKNSVINNNIFNHSERGIQLLGSNNNSILRNIVKNDRNGILILNDSNNNIVRNNSISNNIIWGLYCWESKNNIIEDNSFLKDSIFISGTVYDNYIQQSIMNNTVNGKPLLFWENEIDKTVPEGMGQVFLFNSTNITIKDQEFSDVSIGILTAYSSNILISNNSVATAIWGILLEGNTHNVTLTNNTGYNNHGDVQLWDAYYNNLTNNTFGLNSNFGFVLDNSTSNYFSNNVISETNITGIHLLSGTGNNFLNNSYFNNKGYAVLAESDSFFNIFTFNNFINNNIGFSQSLDNGSFNIFTYNYWNDWIAPDSDNDRIVDDPYTINGSANNFDLSPLAFPSWSQFLLKPIPLTPNLGELLFGNVFLSWTDAVDTWGFAVTYNVFYSADGGSIWNLMASSLTETNYIWDTTGVADGSNYLLRVESVSNGGLTVNVTTPSPFTVDNTPPSVTITSPMSQIYDLSSVTIAFTGDADLYWYYIESVDTQNQTWTSDTTRTLQDGLYTLHVYGFDSVGNVFHTSISFSVDTTPPTVSITSPMSQIYDLSSVTIAFTGDADLYWYYIESVDTQNQTWTSDTTRTLQDGLYTLHVYGFDIVGNVFHTTVTFTIDTSTHTSTTPPSSSSSKTTTGSETVTSPGWSIFIFFISVVLILPIRKYRKKF